MAFAHAVAFVTLGISASALAQTWSAQIPYTSSANSTYFASKTVMRYYFLEDFEDMSVNSKGLSIPDGILHGPSVNTDSVDIDDYTLNGNGAGGVSIGPAGSTLTIQFDNTVLGGYPTKVGFVFTDGQPLSTIQVVATNPQSISVAHLYTGLGDGAINGTTVDDRFIGVDWAAGIAQLQIMWLDGFNEIDHVQYSSPVLAPLYVRDRMNGDVYGDLLWHNTASGVVKLWYMNGMSQIGGGNATLATPISWTAQGCGDFDADGDADILWRDGSNVLRVWLMNGQTVATNSAVQNSGPIAAGFSIIGVADYDGDRKADFLMRNAANSDIWFQKMNGNALVSSTKIGTVAGSEYLGSGDFNGDGRIDVLWRQTSTGAVFGWLMNGPTPIEAAPVGNAAPVASVWIVGAVGDLNADGRADVIWRNTSTGVVNCWLMNNLYRTSGGLSSSIPIAWTMRAAADISGDGKADIIWTNGTTGQVNAWIMNGLIKESGGTIGTLGGIASWKLINR